MESLQEGKPKGGTEKGESVEAAAEIEPAVRRKEIADEAIIKLRVWKLERVETTA